MTVTYPQITLTDHGVSLAVALSLSPGSMACAFAKIRMQLISTATGPWKVQGSTAVYAATTGGIFRTLAQEYFLEMGSIDALRAEQYFVCGAVPGDILNLELHQ